MANGLSGFNPDSSLEKNYVIPALRQAQDKLASGQAGIQMIKNPHASGTTAWFCPLMEQLAIRLSWQTTPAKSLVIRGVFFIAGYRPSPV